MSSGLLNLIVDTKPADGTLREIQRAIPSVEAKALRLVGRLTAKEMNRSLKGTVNARTHSILAHRYEYRMAQTFKYGKVKNHGLAVSPRKLDDTRENDLIIPVIHSLNYGYDMGDARGPHIIGRGFIQSGDDYVASDKYTAEVQKLVDKELDKINRKYQ